jgi:hypothetical protein
VTRKPASSTAASSSSTKRILQRALDLQQDHQAKLFLFKTAFPPADQIAIKQGFYVSLSANPDTLAASKIGRYASRSLFAQ